MPGITGPIAQRSDRGVVAGLLCQDGQVPLKPPGKRMKPVQAAVDLGDECHQAVASLHVHSLVGEDSEKLVTGPSAPFPWQQDLWIECSDRQWHMYLPALAHEDA